MSTAEFNLSAIIADLQRIQMQALEVVQEAGAGPRDEVAEFIHHLNVAVESLSLGCRTLAESEYLAVEPEELMHTGMIHGLADDD